MRNLIAFFKQYSHWVVFLLLEVVSAVLLFQYNSYQGSVWFSSANAVTGKIMEIDAWIGTFFSMGDANQDLTARNIQLEQEVAALREQLTEMQRRDSTWKPSAQEQLLSAFKTIPAKVVGNSVSRPDNLITINKGTADGVRPDMGVACGTGVVGIVYMASAHYAVVLPVLNARSNISCRIRGRGYFGYLHWNGGLSDQAFVDDVPRHAKFEEGDTIETHRDQRLQRRVSAGNPRGAYHEEPRFEGRAVVSSAGEVVDRLCALARCECHRQCLVKGTPRNPQSCRGLHQTAT